MLSASAKPYINASVPVLRQHGVAITTVFYKNMLSAHPELNNLFNQGNQANGSQQQSLAAAVFAYAANIENSAYLAPVLERIAHKHASIGILPSHYPIVGKYLIEAIKEVLGDGATAELISAWEEAYLLLADELIAMENRLYTSNGKSKKQWLKMKVAKKEYLTNDIVSITLIPNPNKKGMLPKFKSGQYISIVAFLEELNLTQMRQYSLSNAENEDCYRIIVKREKGDEFKPEGKFSKWVHQYVEEGDMLDVSHPYGTFAPKLSEDSPITLISAGIGITPMLSILATLVKQKSENKIAFIHATSSDKNIPHYDEIRFAQFALAHLQVTIYCSENKNTEFVHGKMNLLDALNTDLLKGKFLICGPTMFMDDQRKVLIELGVNPINIEREIFGPESLSHLL